MTKNDEHKLWVLQHAERTGQVAKTCRYFGIGRASFYRWKRAYEQDGEAGLVCATYDQLHTSSSSKTANFVVYRRHSPESLNPEGLRF